MRGQDQTIHRETLSTPYASQQSNKKIRNWIEELGFTVEYPHSHKLHNGDKM